MDIGALKASPIGQLVPISGTDWRTGASYRHFAYVPDRLPDAVVLTDATWRALNAVGDELGRLDRIACKVVAAAAGHDVPASPLEPCSATRPALDWARGKPITVGLVNELQAELVRDTRGDSVEAGRVRRGNVFLGGQPGPVDSSRFVPAPHGARLTGAFAHWVQWLNRTDSHMSPLVQAGLAHYQLETLHPYSDGNGRLGRLVIVLALVRRGVLRYPVLDIAPWLRVHRSEYQDRLLDLSRTGDWDAWLTFFAAAIEGAADSTSQRLEALLGDDAAACVPRRRAYPWPASAAAAVLTSFALAACGGSGGSSGAKTTGGVRGPSEVRASPISSAGANPFTPRVGTDRSGMKPPTAAASTTGGPATYVASLPGLYGGTRNYQSCNGRQLVTYLEENPSKARAWASTLGISTSDISSYVSGLTPVLLRTDTRVTNHGYVDGVADPLQSVLEAGTAVFLNSYGEPVVKCYCGNPLTPPELLTEPVYTGPRWVSFTTINITIIQQSTTVINTYTLYDPNTGEEFKRTAGINGHDGPYINVRRKSPTPTPAGPPTTSQPAENPSVSLSPNPVVEGGTVTLTAAGFTPGATLQITVTRPDGVVEHYPLTAGSDGSGTYTFSNAAGNAPLGTYNVSVTDVATGASGSASITVVPPPSSSNPGGTTP